ncbi:MAG: hypothetical protein AAB364_02335 [Patescibacteria group bacterium]
MFWFKKSVLLLCCVVGVSPLMGVSCTQPGQNPDVEVCAAVGGVSPFLWLICPGDGGQPNPPPNASPMPMPIETGGYTINGVLFPGGVFSWSGGSLTPDFTGLFQCRPSATSAIAQVYGPGVQTGNEWRPGPMVAQMNLLCSSLRFTWFPPGSGRYIVIIQDNTGYAQVWVLVIVLANNPNPPEPNNPATLEINLTSPTDMQTLHVGGAMTFSGNIVGGSPPFILQVDTYDNRRLIEPLGNLRTFSLVVDPLDLATTGFRENLVQVTSADGQIEHRIVKTQTNP